MKEWRNINNFRAVCEISAEKSGARLKLGDRGGQMNNFHVISSVPPVTF
jgi:hypothetical protein